MQRRVIAAIAAVLLAGVGAVLLYSYVNSADKRAMAGQEATTVLVVTKVIPTGTPAEGIAPYVEVRQLPKAAVVPGAITVLNDIAGLATTTELQVGEQLMSARFADPATTQVGVVAVPKDMQEVSFLAESQRAVGSTIAAGDKVDLYVTFDDLTKLTLADVLVIKVQGAIDEAASESGAATGGSVTYTVALKAQDVERAIYAAEHGKVWLSRVTPESANQTTTGTTLKNVFK
jgi:pilus assembly protein CpaB